MGAAPVRFGQRGWLAQHPWLEPTIGIALLLPVGWLYFLSVSTVGRTVDILLAAAWLGFIGAGWAWRSSRPCSVLRFPAYALAVWLVLMGVALN